MRWIFVIPVAFIALTRVAFAASPAEIPVQGVLTELDGTPIDGTFPVVYTLYTDAAGATAVWSDAYDTGFDSGFFTTYLGENTATNPLDLALLRDNNEMYLGIAVDGDTEMPLISIATAPYAGYAAHAGDAETLESYSAADFLFQAVADGGIELTGTDLSLTTACADGEILIRTASGWACAVQTGDPTDELLISVGLNGSILEITDAAGLNSVDLASLIADADDDVNNELNAAALLNGTVLEITDAGGTLLVDLATLVDDADADATNELLSAAVLNGTLLEITDAAGTLQVDLATLQDGVDDADADATNELNTSLFLNGTSLEVTDSGGVLSADLIALRDDADANPLNELNASLVLNGTSIEITDAAGVLAADLSSLVDDADADPANELNRTLGLNGTSLELTDNGGLLATDLSSLLDTAADVLAKLITVDGAGSGLDADQLDGLHASDIIAAAGPENRTEISSIPYIITLPGSYVVTQNLTNTTVIGDGITIDSDNVTLDLGGFTLDGNNLVVASDDGIVVLGDQKSIHIYNGVVTNWGGDGINALNADHSQFENLMVSFNGGDGLVGDFSCVMSHITAVGNGLDGIEADDGSVITNCTAQQNGDNGIQTSEGCVVTDSAAYLNSSDGIDVAAGSVVRNCSASDNGIAGFDMGLGGTISGSSAYDNICWGFDLASSSNVYNNIAALTGGDATLCGNGDAIREPNESGGFRSFANARFGDNVSHENDGTGFTISSTDVRLDGNSATDNDLFGYYVSASGGLVIRNTAAGNLTNYSIVATTAYGPIINVTGAGDISGVAGANHPFANFEY